MPIECARCAFQTHEVEYRRPEDPGKEVRILHVLIVVSAILSLISLVGTLRRVLGLTDLADDLEAAYGQDAQLSQDAFQELVAIFSNASYLLFAVVLGVLIYIPVKYTILWFRLPKGSPRTLRHLRRTARLQLGIGFFGLIATLAVFGATRFGATDLDSVLQLLVPPFILWFTYLPNVRLFFSDFRLRPVGEGEHTFRPRPEGGHEGGPGADAETGRQHAEGADGDASPEGSGMKWIPRK